MDPRLVIFNAGYIIGALLIVALTIFVLYRAKFNHLTAVFCLMNISIAIVEITIVWGANIIDPRASLDVMQYNLANIFIVIFIAHWVVVMLGRFKSQIFNLGIIYAIGLFFFIYFLIYPNTFLLLPKPKLYFPNYFEPGSLYYIMRIYFNLVFLYIVYQFVAGYKQTKDGVMKNRIKYAATGIIFGVCTGTLALPLVFDIPVDPLLSFLFPLYTVPLAYAIIQYELMDIKIVAKQALVYALTVSFLSSVLSLVSFSNDLIATRAPGFPHWIVPVSVSAVASIIGLAVWRRLRETDILKYEFITVVTHKFRTPLTYIKWAADNLSHSFTAPTAATTPGSGAIQTSVQVSDQKVSDQNTELQTIQVAVSRLVELTNVLISVADSENGSVRYAFISVPLAQLVDQALQYQERQIKNKNIKIIKNYQATPIVLADTMRLSLVLQTILENALMYTSAGGTVTITLGLKDKQAFVSIADSGIGIPKDELNHVFAKFYRGSLSKKIDTEGMGVGLFIAKQIIEKHDGKISVYSEGEGHGSTFTVFLPVKQ